MLNVKLMLWDALVVDKCCIAREPAVAGGVVAGGILSLRRFTFHDHLAGGKRRSTALLPRAVYPSCRI